MRLAGGDRNDKTADAQPKCLPNKVEVRLCLARGEEPVEVATRKLLAEDHLVVHRSEQRLGVDGGGGRGGCGAEERHPRHRGTSGGCRMYGGPRQVSALCDGGTSHDRLGLAKGGHVCGGSRKEATGGRRHEAQLLNKAVSRRSGPLHARGEAQGTREAAGTLAAVGSRGVPRSWPRRRPESDVVGHSDGRLWLRVAWNVCLWRGDAGE